jgi:hypothetical protein
VIGSLGNESTLEIVFGSVAVAIRRPAHFYIRSMNLLPWGLVSLAGVRMS